MTIRKSMAPWLGALVATPALTVNVAPASATSMQPRPTAVSAGAGDRSALMTGLLSMSLDEKIAVAGDRIGADPLAVTIATSRVRGATVMKTNTDIPECHAASTASGAAKGNIHRGSAQCGSSRGTDRIVSTSTTCTTHAQTAPAVAGAAVTPGTYKATQGKSGSAKRCGATSPGNPVPSHAVSGCRPQ